MRSLENPWLRSILFGPYRLALSQRLWLTLLVALGVLALPLHSVAQASPAVIELSALDGSNGFRVDGKVAGDELGWAVAGAGDVNGDGYDDLIVGAPYAGFNSNGAGSAYVVFGHAGAFSHPLAVSSLDGSNGFHIPGIAAGDKFGWAVSSAGDVNGDGYADMLIGAPEADLSHANAGSAFVLFGKNGGFHATEFLLLIGSNGFAINGAAAYDAVGSSVAAAGDHNGDGFDDLIIGAPYADSTGAKSGKSYVVFGKANGFPSMLELSEMLGGTQGYTLLGEIEGDYSGRSVSGAGDFNGDGYADVIIGADHRNWFTGYHGRSYLVLGKSGVYTTYMGLQTLNGSNGFRLNSPLEYDESGYSVDSAGDINGDGYADLIIGAPGDGVAGIFSGSSYVVFGRSGAWTHPYSLSGLNGANGFRIDGDQPGSYFGISVSAAGDINGDGVDDLLVGAMRADAPMSQSGRTYVVFGCAGSGFPHPLSLASLDGSNGFRIDGVADDDRSGYSVSAAGDINGDGIGDLVIGAPQANVNGKANAGSSYVVFGSDRLFSSDRLFADDFEL